MGLESTSGRKIVVSLVDIPLEEENRTSMGEVPQGGNKTSKRATGILRMELGPEEAF